MDAMQVCRRDPGCRFCGFPSRMATDGFDLPIAESDHFFALPSVGSFVPGWTLVCPKEHHLNLAGLYGTAEFVEFSSRVASAISHAYGDTVVVFEHGCRRAGSLTGCGTDHAHLHLVPFQGSLEAAVRQFDAASQWVAGRAQDVNRLLGDREYLLMADSLPDLRAAALFRAVEAPQSQYFRLALATALGLRSMANYRAYPFAELAVQAASRLRADLQDPVEVLQEVA